MDEYVKHFSSTTSHVSWTHAKFIANTAVLNFNSEYFLLIEKSPLVEKQGERDDSSTSVRF